MTERLPYYPYYPADITLSTQAMTDEQFGAYQRLLNFAWGNDGLPNDLEAVRAIGRWTRPAFGRLWEAIGPKWHEQGGRLVNTRQENERGKVLRRSDAGRANAGKRWHSNGTTAGNATASPPALQKSCISESEPDQEPPIAPQGGRKLTRAAKKALAIEGGMSDWRDLCRERGHGGRCDGPKACTNRLAVEAECPHEPKCATFHECSTRDSGAA